MMDQSKQTNSRIEDELNRHHRTATMTISICFALTALLVILVLADVQFPLGTPSPTLAKALWVSILFFGLGAVTLRRTRFSAMRLQDVAALRGTTGLLSTLQNTTMLVALLGAAIAFMGFLIAQMTGDNSPMWNAAIISVAVLIYCYPRRAAWRRVVEMLQTQGKGDDAPPVKGRIA